MLAGIHFSDLLLNVNRRRHCCEKLVSPLKKAIGPNMTEVVMKPPIGSCVCYVFDRCHKLMFILGFIPNNA